MTQAIPDASTKIASSDATATPSSSINAASLLTTSLIKPPSVPVPDALALYNRTAEMTSFSWKEADEPHAVRRRIILAAHPQIAELFGAEPLTALLIIAIVIVQIFFASLCCDMSWTKIFLFGWSVGGTLNHSLQLAAHELSHNLCFDSAFLNKVMAVICNFPTTVPSAITFARYHMDHHAYQGVDGLDTDIPSDLETFTFRSPFAKILWIFLQPLFYAFRPVCIKPKPIGRWEMINLGFQILFDVAIVYFFGVKAFSYLIIGTFLGLGLHPAAGHFIAEHYELVSGVETYSYYGAWNYANFNVGYHNEHHDFPRVPWTRLPKLKAIASEYYDSLPQYTSYLALFFTYILYDELGPFARVKRSGKSCKALSRAASIEKSDSTTDVTAGVKPTDHVADRANTSLLWIMYPFFGALISFVIYHAIIAA